MDVKRVARKVVLMVALMVAQLAVSMVDCLRE